MTETTDDPSWASIKLVHQCEHCNNEGIKTGHYYVCMYVCVHVCRITFTDFLSNEECKQTRLPNLDMHVVYHNSRTSISFQLSLLVTRKCPLFTRERERGRNINNTS